MATPAALAAQMALALPPLHELARNVGIELPEYLGRLEEEDGDDDEAGGWPDEAGGALEDDPGSSGEG